ncbi:MAG: response regulator transcription factor [Planctomycetes bacterium]|nr:response regulator transcription factor [Planctomycetota bacterium]MCB9868225.1 response regulator transcription factor [Planctomycetota bacterium]MCB9888798.1 response regulator transcription factor [Planctomycetota bacterium]
MKTSILLADDHQIIRDGLRSLLEASGDCEVVGEATDGRTAVKLVKKLQPELVIMDIGMPDLNGVEATLQIRREHPSTRVIALSMHSDASYVGRMLKAGASAYLLKESAFEELAVAITEVRNNRVFLGRGITGVLVDDYVRKLNSETDQGKASLLTPKEREVLQLIAEGYSTKEIAARLFVSVKTIETHRQNIMKRLEIHSIAQLTKFAIREGLTSLDP